ncbi:nucleotide sugar dehydrogenase [Paraburkholderia sp. GAS32]|uniref:nucleotide sugar dehydrogenase n=1 Tax=Paraburkholderia sp. GAS32 TaxID=3035129 RepID=UPI003D19B725
MKQLVCIQGLGFVGAAMAVACARAGTRNGGAPVFDVVGLDLATETGEHRVSKINTGEFPFGTTDTNLIAQTRHAHEAGNLKASTDVSVLAAASIVVVDVHFDIGDLTGEGHLEFGPFIRAIETVGQHIQPGTLVVVETTVPPGTCSKVIRPVLDRCAEARGLKAGAFLLAHAYERVMPGDNYLASITDFWRVFAGDTPEAGDACEAFLSHVVNVAEFPLTRLSHTTASETSKVLENSYRAVNIAFMDEWGRFAEKVGIDMFEVINAIRKRPTHNNMKQPGFGVGGYCLTKDPLFADLAAKDIFNLTDIEFPLSRSAVKINQDMPLYSLDKVRGALGSLADKRLLLAGISYRQDVADTRYSPSQPFYEGAVIEGAEVSCHDPLLGHWDELELDVATSLDACPDVDAVVFAVPHKEFRALQPAAWLGGRKPYILDANDCLSHDQRAQFAALGCRVESIGRGTRA